MKPSSLLPFTVVEQGKFAYLYPVSPFDAGKRADMPLRCVALRQPEEMQDLRYLAHAANAYPAMVEMLREVMSKVPEAADCRRIQDLLVSIGEIR